MLEIEGCLKVVRVRELFEIEGYLRYRDVRGKEMFEI